MVQFLEAIAIMFGTIVGAGVFGLPFTMRQFGYIPALFLFAFLAGAVTLLHLLYGEIVLRTSKRHRLPGYGKLYLGKWAEKFFLGADVLGVGGALLAYLILGGSFLAGLLGGDSFWWTILFWIILSLCVLGGLRTIARLELILGILLLAVFIILTTSIAPHVRLEYLAGVSRGDFLAPFGIMLFALWGLNGINPAREHLGERARILPMVLILGTLIPAIVYVFFTFAVVGAAGPATPPDALAGMRERFGSLPVLLGLAGGVLAVTTSFLTLAAYLGDLFRYDERIPRLPAYGAALLIPLALYILGVRQFISVLSVTGAVLGGVSGALLIAVYSAARKKGDRLPEYRVPVPIPALAALATVLLAGAAAELLRAVKIL